MKAYLTLAAACVGIGLVTAVGTFLVIAPYWLIVGQATPEQWAQTYSVSAMVGVCVGCFIGFMTAMHKAGL